MLTAPQMSIALSAMYRSFSTGRRWLPAAALGLSLFLLPCAAFAKKIRDEAPAQQQPAARAPVASASISKTVAVESTIVALAANGSDAAEQTLEKVVTGEIKFGGHDKQAAQLALVQLIMKPTPRSEAFVLRLFTDPDESIRPVDKSDYPGNVIRSDAANIVAKVGSPSLRLALAKAYSTSVQAPAARTAIEGILRTPHPANFAAQIAILRSPKVSPLLKMELQKLVFEKNESAVKQGAAAGGGRSPRRSRKRRDVVSGRDAVRGRRVVSRDVREDVRDPRILVERSRFDGCRADARFSGDGGGISHGRTGRCEVRRPAAGD